jgi:hypothetical protein
MTGRTPEAVAVNALSRMQVLPWRRRSGKNASAMRRDRKRTSGWGWRDNIIGVGVGVKQTGGKRTKDADCVTLFVRQKLPPSRLRRSELVPEWLELESGHGRVLTDLIALGSRPVAHAARVRPLQPGAEIGHSRGGRGTLGPIVRRIGRNEKLALSCSHVLALSGRLFDGIVDIEQPVTDGSDNTNDLVGRVLDGFSVLKSGSSASNRDDVAIAKLSVTADPALLTTGTTPLTASTLSRFPVGTRTRLQGVVTTDAPGRVLAHGATFTIGEMPFVNGEVPFTGLIAYETRCARGDSGAAVMQDGTQEVLGLHTAGIAEERFGLFQPIGPILARLGLELVVAQ